MTDYSKMTKAELIDHAHEVDEIIQRNVQATKDIYAKQKETIDILTRMSDRDTAEIKTLRAEYDALLHSAPTYRPGWWLGVALFAAILIPWVLFGIWVVG